MNDTYIIFLNPEGEFYESFEKDSPEGDLFTTSDINSAYQFKSLDEARDFCDEHFHDAVVLKWM